MRRRLSGSMSIQERVERTPLGQGLISAVIVIVVLAGITWSLPTSAVKSDLRSLTDPITLSVGLDQYWGVFAPNPPRVVQDVDFVVTDTAGNETTWHIPKGDPILSHYWDYRWHKLKENVVNSPSLRADFAGWVAAHVDGARAARLRMVLHTRTLPPPGDTRPGTVTTTVIYDEPVSVK